VGSPYPQTSIPVTAHPPSFTNSTDVDIEEDDFNWDKLL